jgi:hypothetical protein
MEAAWMVFLIMMYFAHNVFLMDPMIHPMVEYFDHNDFPMDSVIRLGGLPR